MTAIRLTQSGLYRAPIFPEDRFWQPNADLRSVLSVPSIRIAESELLVTAHHLPVVVAVDGYETSVVALIDETHTARPVFHPVSGQIARGYTPILLRAAPFRLNEQDGTLEIRSDFIVRHKAESRPLFSDEGKLHPSLSKLQQSLAIHQSGCVRLSAAANSLFATNILVELPRRSSDFGSVRYYTVDNAAFRSLTRRQLISLSTHGYLPFDLIASLIFSRRQLRLEFRRNVPSDDDISSFPLTAEAIDQIVRDVGNLDFQMDEDELISADQIDVTNMILPSV